MPGSAGRWARALGRQEYLLNQRVVEGLWDRLKGSVPCYMLPFGSTLSEKQKLIKNSWFIPPSIGLEVHFNAFNSRATGTEVFLREKESPAIRRLALEIVRTTAETLGVTPRGLKDSKQSAVGSLGWLRSKPGNILWEVCFMDNPKDIHSFLAKEELLLDRVAEVLKQASLAD